MSGVHEAGRPGVVLIGTCDTKGAELAFVAERLRALGASVTLVDVGTGEPAGAAPDIDGDMVAKAAGQDRAALRAAGDRGAAMAAMAKGAGEVLIHLRAEGHLDGVIGLGGSGGASVASAAMRRLPIGVPKLLLTTVAGGDVAPYVGQTDMTLMYSVLDIAGLNSVSTPIFENAAAAIAGMARAAAARGEAKTARRRTVAISMFGVTTPAANAAREWLEARGFEVLVFHANGAGGRTLEALIDAGAIDGVLDLTTTELADELVGGVLSAGPDRLGAAGRRGIPQVVGPGALDMVNFGPRESVPAAFAGRLFYQHNPNVTLMRTTPDECARLGEILAGKLNAARGRRALFLPLRGVSALSVAGKPFFDPAADAALFAAIARTLSPEVLLERHDVDINNVDFARAMARTLDSLMDEEGRMADVAQ